MKTYAKIGIGFLLCLALLWLINSSKIESPKLTGLRLRMGATGGGLSGPSTYAPDSTQRKPSGDSSPSKAKDSLSKMAKILFQFTRPEHQIKDLISFLEAGQYEPQVGHDANAFTGDMAIVRTKRPPPGTRYFHAQYFSDENGGGFVQHMSFEYQPSPTAMSDALTAIQEAFQLTKPEIETVGYAKWNLDADHIIWIKKLAAEDLHDDPFNAYTAADVGTIRVAVEVEIHGANEE